MDRVIALTDCNCFFASCLVVKDPTLAGKPIVVAGDPKTRRGVVLAINYEARRLAAGQVRAGMPVSQALRLLPPEVLVLPPDPRLFEEVSDRFLTVLQKFSPVNERASIDEVYSDWSGCTHLFGGDPVAMARKVKEAIREEVGIPVSVGIGHSKIVAKMAAELQKPDGLVLLTHATWVERVHPLPVGDLYGVGPKTAAKLRDLGILTVGDLAGVNPAVLSGHFGTLGQSVRRAARGEDDDPVRERRREETKSISNETTLSEDLADRGAQRRVVLDLADHVGARLRAHGFLGRTVTLRVRDPAFLTFTRAFTLPSATDETEIIYRTACALLDAHLGEGKPVRLLGVGVSGLESAGREVTGPTQLTLFDLFQRAGATEPRSGPPAVGQRAQDQRAQGPQPGADSKLRKLDQAIDAIRLKYGKNAILRLSQTASGPARRSRVPWKQGDREGSGDRREPQPEE